MTTDLKLTLGFAGTGLLSIIGESIIAGKSNEIRTSHFKVYESQSFDKLWEINNEENADMKKFNVVRRISNGLAIASLGCTIADAVTQKEYDDDDIHLDTIFMGAADIVGIGADVIQYTRQRNRLKRIDEIVETEAANRVRKHTSEPIVIDVEEPNVDPE